MVLCCSALTISDCEAAQRWGCNAPSADGPLGSSSALCHGCNRDFPPDQCAHSAETRFTVTSVIRSLSHSRSWRGSRRSRIVRGCPSYPTIPVMIAKRNAITSNHRRSPTTIPRGERMRKFSVSRATLMMLTIARQFRARTTQEGHRSLQK